jgi:hypothetical protein
LTRRAGLLGFVALVLGPSLLGAGGPAEAQEAAAQQPRLIGQTPWVAEDQPFSLAFAVEGDLPAGGTVELTLYGALTSREALVRGAADPTVLGDVRDTLSVPTALVPRGRDRAFRLHLATDGSNAGLPVADAGVYPLALAIAGPDGTPGPRLLTTIVRTPEDAAATPLLTAVLLPLRAPPSYGPDGEAVVSDRARRLLEIRSGLLDKYDDVALTVAPTPETLAALVREDPDLLATVRSALADRHVVGGPFVRLDLAAFAGVPELAAPLEDQFQAGDRTLRRVLRQDIDERTWVGTGNPTTAALDALAGAGIDRALFRQESVTGPSVPIDEPVVVTGATGQTIDAVLADAVLRAHVNGTGDPVLMAHRALADLALLASPEGEGGVADDDGDAGVALELTANRPLPAAFLDTLLAGLQAGGPVRAVSLAGLLDADPSGEPGVEPGPVVEGIPLVGQDLTDYGHNLAITRETVDGYASFAGQADPLTRDLRRRLLVSGAIDLTESRRASYLRSVSLAISARTAAVAITDDETVTLTSREGDIPLTIRNDTGAPVEVRLSFDSDNKLEFPAGSTQRLRLDEGPNRVEVPVVARASGAFPLRITATSPDGVLTVTRARVTVRSTAVSGVGLVLSVGALLVLVIWWASHWRSARRNRRLVDPHAGGPPEPAPA